MKKILLSQRGLSVLGVFKGISTAVCVIYCVILMGSAVGPCSETIDETTFIKGSIIIFGAFVLQTLISIAHGRRVDRQSIAERRRISKICIGGLVLAVIMLLIAIEGVFSIEYSRWHTYNTQRSIMEDMGRKVYSSPVEAALDFVNHEPQPLNGAERLILSELYDTMQEIERTLWYLACLGFALAEFSIAGFNIALIELPTKITCRIHDS